MNELQNEVRKLKIKHILYSFAEKVKTVSIQSNADAKIVELVNKVTDELIELK